MPSSTSRGDVYRAQNNNHNTVFLATSEGIILGDPINAEFSEWLKAELADRFGVLCREGRAGVFAGRSHNGSSENCP